VGSAPENLPASGALPKLIVINAGQRLELLENGRFVDRRERGIAVGAPGERLQITAKTKSPYHFDRLFHRIGRTRTVPFVDNGMH
jgi:hypothetical protein